MITNLNGINGWVKRTPQQRIFASVTQQPGDGIIYSYTEDSAIKVILKNNNCWTSNVHIEKQGYSRISINGKRRQLHIFSWEIFKAPIPEGYVIDHLCLNKTCANPDHLEPVLPIENDRRARFHYIARHTHCQKGHPLEGDNIKWKFVSNTRMDRQCRICLNVSKRNSYHKNKQLKGYYTSTHCRQGHLYDQANTRWNKKGNRICLTCKKEWQRRYLANTKNKG